MPVYEPQEDSELLRIFVERLAHGDVLDMGTGSGTLALAAAEKEEVNSVLAVDIDGEALAHVEAQLSRGREFLKKIRLRKSDLFTEISSDERFDIILFNPPYLPQEPGDVHMALYGGPRGSEIIARFLAQARDHLKPGGSILLLFSSLSNKEMVIHHMKDGGYLFEELAIEAHFFEQLYVFRLRRRE